jgi:hypothetical protein
MILRSFVYLRIYKSNTPLLPVELSLLEGCTVKFSGIDRLTDHLSHISNEVLLDMILSLPILQLYIKLFTFEMKFGMTVL